MRRLRTLALAALLTSLSLGPSPASAAPAHLVFTGDAHVRCFGCNIPSPCHASLDILAGTHTGSAATTYCYVVQGAGALCLVTGSAYGTVVGTSGTAADLDLGFTWTRVGAVAVITVSGDSTGQGEALFIAPDARCGVPLDATIVGWVGGV